MAEGPDYLNDVMAPIHRLGEPEAGGIMMDTDPDEMVLSRAKPVS